MFFFQKTIYLIVFGPLFWAYYKVPPASQVVGRLDFWFRTIKILNEWPLELQGVELRGSSHLGYVVNNHGDRIRPLNGGYGTPYKWPKKGLNGL